LSLPYAKIRGSQIVVIAVDNFTNLGASASSKEWGAIEVTILGSVGGYSFLLKRQQIRMMTGPCLFLVPYDAAYDEISVESRNVTGGVAAMPYDARQVLQVQVHVQPRGGDQQPKR